MLQFRKMATFATVVEAGTFTAAAVRLGVAKSAISKSVSDLEEELGVLLLHRTTRRLALTEAGSRYYEGCARMIGVAEAAESEVRDFRAEPSGLLRLTAPVVFGADHVVPLVAKFMEAHPRLRVEVNLEDRYVNLIEEGMDLAVRAGVLEDSSLVVRRLAPVTSVVCGSPQYLKHAGVPKTPADLARHDWIYYTPLSRQLSFRQGERQFSITVKANLSTNSGNAVIVLLREGRGLTLAPLWIVKNDLVAGRLKAVLTAYEIRRTAIHALFPEGKNLLPRVRLLVESLVEYCRENDWAGIDPDWIAGE